MNIFRRQRSRWPDWVHTRIGPGIVRSEPSPEGRRRWDADVAAFRASKHREPREMIGPPSADTGWGAPAARDGERLVFNYISYRLFEVTRPRNYGFRLVGLVVDGHSLVWELPGYNRADAETLCINFVDDYL